MKTFKCFKYWICPNLDGSVAYNLRGKTKKEVQAKRAESGNPEFYGEPEKREIQYSDLMDLVDNCIGENRGGE